MSNGIMDAGAVHFFAEIERRPEGLAPDARFIAPMSIVDVPEPDDLRSSAKKCIPPDVEPA